MKKADKDRQFMLECGYLMPDGTVPGDRTYGMTDEEIELMEIAEAEENARLAELGYASSSEGSYESSSDEGEEGGGEQSSRAGSAAASR